MSRIFVLDMDGADNISKIIVDFCATENHALTASVRALNKTAIWLRTHATRQIASEKRLPQKLVRERLRVLKASRNNLKSMVLANFLGIKTNKVGTPRQTRRGAKVKSYDFPGAFVATMPGRHTGIYRRKGKTRLPIRELYVPLEPESSEVIKGFLDNRIKQRFETIFRHELRFLMQR